MGKRDIYSCGNRNAGGCSGGCATFGWYKADSHSHPAQSDSCRRDAQTGEFSLEQQWRGVECIVCLHSNWSIIAGSSILIGGVGLCLPHGIPRRSPGSPSHSKTWFGWELRRRQLLPVHQCAHKPFEH